MNWMWKDSRGQRDREIAMQSKTLYNLSLGKMCCTFLGDIVQPWLRLKIHDLSSFSFIRRITMLLQINWHWLSELTCTQSQEDMKWLTCQEHGSSHKLSTTSKLGKRRAIRPRPAAQTACGNLVSLVHCHAPNPINSNLHDSIRKQHFYMVVSITQNKRYWLVSCKIHVFLVSSKIRRKRRRKRNTCWSLLLLLRPSCPLFNTIKLLLSYDIAR